MATEVVTSVGTGATAKVAEVVANIRYEEIPAPDILVSKMHMVDTLGVMIAGTCDQATQGVMEYAREFGGRAEATAIGFGERLPAPLAGMVNSVAARAFDLDDCHEGNATHTSVTVIPAAMAIAERGKAISGKEFLTAVTMGGDLVARVSSAANLPGNVTGWAPSMVTGTFGAAASAARLLGLDSAGVVRALGLALARAAGTLRYAVDDGAYHVNFGFVVESGIASALLAEKGIYFALEAFEGKSAYFQAYERGEYDINKLVGDLGKRFEGSYVSFKPYPTCKHTHTSITAVLDLVERYDLHPDDIESIWIRGNRSTAGMSRDPRKVEFDPANRYEARAGLEKLIGVAVVKRRVFLDDVTERALADPAHLERVRSVSTRVRVTQDDELERLYGRGVGPAIAEIVTRDRRTLTNRTDFVKGHPNNPMSYEEIEDKFRACLPFASRSVDRGKAEEALALIRDLESVEDVAVLPRLLS